MSSSPPTTLGKYQIIREIARSNDIVYEAYDPLMNRRVAVKELAVPGGSTSQQQDDRLKRFLREAKAAGSLAHPNIVTIYEVGEDGGRHYLVMEYLDGHTLRNELDAKGFLPPEEAIKVAEAVLRALEYAHQNGVIHRDIKPENIQLLTDGRIKLTDFGIARLTFEPNLTMDGQVFGTPSYMSPEQVVGREIDLRSDIFSVGIVLYEMLAGRKPFAGDSVVAITYAIMNKEPDQAPQINHALWQVVSRALDKSASQRYASSSDMLKALASARQASAGVILDPKAHGQPQFSQSPYGANPTQNPFLSQQPYSGGSYPNVQPPPIQYPYNPYTPYPGGGALGSQQPVGPVTQNPYDPYQQAYQPSQQTYLPNPGTVPPVYYPPPPRKPMLNHDQREFAGKVAIVLLTLGTIFLVIVVILLNYSGAFQRNNSPEGAAPSGVGQPSPDPPASTDTSQPLGDATPQNETVGLNFVHEAESDTDPILASKDWGSAVENFEKAGKAYVHLGDPTGAQRCYDEAGESRLSMARNLESTDRERARNVLYTARKEVSPGSPLRQDIDDEITKLT